MYVVRFSIRDLAFATVIVAVGVGWYVDRARLEADRAFYQDQMFRKSEEVRDRRKRISELEAIIENAGIVIPPGPTIGDLLDAIHEKELTSPK